MKTAVLLPTLLLFGFSLHAGTKDSGGDPITQEFVRRGLQINRYLSENIQNIDYGFDSREFAQFNSDLPSALRADEARGATNTFGSGRILDLQRVLGKIYNYSAIPVNQLKVVMSWHHMCGALVDECDRGQKIVTVDDQGNFVLPSVYQMKFRGYFKVYFSIKHGKKTLTTIHFGPQVAPNDRSFKSYGKTLSKLSLYRIDPQVFRFELKSGSTANEWISTKTKNYHYVKLNANFEEMQELLPDEQSFFSVFKSWDESWDSPSRELEIYSDVVKSLEEFVCLVGENHGPNPLVSYNITVKAGPTVHFQLKRYQVPLNTLNTIDNKPIVLSQIPLHSSCGRFPSDRWHGLSGSVPAGEEEYIITKFNATNTQKLQVMTATNVARFEDAFSIPIDGILRMTHLSSVNSNEDLRVIHFRTNANSPALDSGAIFYASDPGEVLARITKGQLTECK